jgi:hypothetical protein
MCSGCNRRHNRDRQPHEKYMRKSYGASAAAELDSLRMSLEKVTDKKLKEMLQQSKAMV